MVCLRHIFYIAPQGRTLIFNFPLSIFNSLRYNLFFVLNDEFAEPFAGAENLCLNRADGKS